LEQLVLDRRTLATKDLVASRYADLVYEGRWWTTERAAYDALVNVTQEAVTGTVSLSLYKGNVTIVGRTSPYALYDERFVTFGADDVYQQADAAGFIRLFGLTQRVAALKARERAAAAATNGATSGSTSGPPNGALEPAPALAAADAEAGEPAGVS
jgi:argininosuccinate synthase